MNDYEGLSYDEWLWWMDMNHFYSFLNGYYECLWFSCDEWLWMVANGCEWPYEWLWSVMNGHEWFWYYDMNDCALCISTYFNHFNLIQFQGLLATAPPFPRGPKRQTRGKRWTVLDGPLVGGSSWLPWSNEESDDPPLRIFRKRVQVYHLVI